MPAPSAFTPSSDAHWYYSHSGNVVGPVPFSSIRALWEAQELPTDTLATPEGPEDWQALSDVLGAFSVPSSPPPLPPALSPLQASQGAKSSDAKSQRTMVFVLIALVCVLLLTLPGMMGRSSGRSEDSPSRSTPTKTRPSPAVQTADKTAPPSGLNESDKAAMKSALMTLLQELESFRSQESFHLRGFAKTGRADWMAKVKAIGEQATAKDGSTFNPITLAAADLEGIGMGYLRSKGMETDSIRSSKEAMADQLEAPEIVEVRSKMDFDSILSGQTQVLYEGFRVVSMADMIEGAKANRIPWHIAERVLFIGRNIDARLVRFDDQHLIYETKTSKGSLLVFGLKRNTLIERRFAKEFPRAEALYKELMAGRSTEFDPLRTAYVNVTSGYKWEEDKQDKETMLVRVIHLIDRTD